MVCAGVEKGEEGPHVMLECDRCLAGCHLGCMSPPLAEVPEVRGGMVGGRGGGLHGGGSDRRGRNKVRQLLARGRQWLLLPF